MRACIGCQACVYKGKAPPPSDSPSLFTSEQLQSEQVTIPLPHLGTCPLERLDCWQHCSDPVLVSHCLDRRVCWHIEISSEEYPFPCLCTNVCVCALWGLQGKILFTDTLALNAPARPSTALPRSIAGLSR
eukprot:1155823-Pelagomonas_calceolata.AAC.4